jgi:hypothetical protein
VGSCLSILVALSLHVGLEGGYNNVHPHARCEQEHIVYGAYYNSESNPSAYVGKILEVEGLPNVKLELGLVTGYSGSPVVPMMRVTKDGWYMAPAYETGFGGNWGVTVGYEFKLW